MPRVLLSDEERAARIRASKQKWAKQNADKIKEYRRKYVKENKERLAFHNKTWRYKDHEAYKAYRRLHYHTVVKPLQERLKAGSFNPTE